MVMKMRYTIVLTITMLVLYYTLNRHYEGYVVAKLPFSPIALVHKLSHRGLKGDDPTDCSMVRREEEGRRKREREGGGGKEEEEGKRRRKRGGKEEEEEEEKREYLNAPGHLRKSMSQQTS